MEQTFIIPMPIVENYHILTRNTDVNKRVILIMMTHITEEEEKQLDEGKQITITRGDATFDIQPTSIYCYGNVDFSTGSSDYDIIESFDFLNYLTAIGLPIVSRYNYEKHECSSTMDKCLWTETWNPAEIAQYIHGCLGKPERIVLFKYIKGK